MPYDDELRTGDTINGDDVICDVVLSGDVISTSDWPLLAAVVTSLAWTEESTGEVEVVRTTSTVENDRPAGVEVGGGSSTEDWRTGMAVAIAADRALAGTSHMVVRRTCGGSWTLFTRAPPRYKYVSLVCNT